MTKEESIIEFGSWLHTPAGQYLLAWEQERLDQALSDAFGFHALQLGLPEIDGLRANRMPHRWVASDTLYVPDPLPLPPPVDPMLTTQPAHPTIALHCEFDALPFPDNSIDLVVLPHTLELARDPHLTLREVERVLVAEGRVAICGLNPASLWGVRQRAGRLRRTVGRGSERGLYLPDSGEFIGYWRLRDWLRLLGFEVEAGRFGCWRPPLRGEKWLQRFAWLDPIGDRWWPVLGAVYFLEAVKRVRGMRLVGLVRSDKRTARAATSVVAQRRREVAPIAERAEIAELAESES
jgi:SAM-dependent methyltransferase